MTEPKRLTSPVRMDGKYKTVRGTKINAVYTVSRDTKIYPVVVEDAYGKVALYTSMGRHIPDGDSPLDLVECSPYEDFVRGEPVITAEGKRRYFSHVGEDGLPYYFVLGRDVWSSEGQHVSWGSVRRLTPEEREERDRMMK